MSRLPTRFALGLSSIALLACVTEPDDGFTSFGSATLPTTTLSTTNSTLGTESGDGDGDPASGDGDGDPSGDGDGDPSGDGDGDPSGDGDGDPSGDGDGDPNCPWVPNPEQNPLAECDPILQDCPGGEKCVAYISGAGSWDNNRCVPVQGNATPGQPCSVDSLESAIDTCDADGQCFNVDVDLNGTCLAFCGCTYEMPDCLPGTTCSVSNAGSIALCVDTCDPLLQDCPNGQGCYLSQDGLICAPTSANLPPGDPCGFLNDCSLGNSCFNIPACGGNCCTPFCDLNGNGAECAVIPGTTCQMLDGVGVCQ